MSIASLSFRALGTTATLCVTDPSGLNWARTLLERELVETDLACSRFRSDSELVRLNAFSGRWVSVSPRLLEAIEVALDAASASGGLVTPTVGRAVRLAGYDRSFELVRLRDGQAFRAALDVPPLDWQLVRVSPRRRLVLVPRRVELDLGATAKALAADRAARAVVDAVGGGALVSLGGDVAVTGEPPPGGWSIRLADDHSAPLDSLGPAVSVRSGGLASSGTAVRRWCTGRVELHHIVDPRSGSPATTPWRTVSVAARSCLDANVASTAAVVLGDEAPAWLAERRLPARLVRTNGLVSCVAGWPDEPDAGAAT